MQKAGAHDLQQEATMPQSDEAFVKESWPNGLPEHIYKHRFDLVDMYGNINYPAAAAFTGEHKRKIAEREQEISLIKCVMSLQSISDPVWSRILATLAESLAQMKQGMKETV